MGKRWIAVTKCTSLNLKNFKKPSHQNHPTKPPHKSLKMMWKILTVALFATCVCADLVEEEGDARLGYITVGLFILVLGALVLPLFGISMGETEETGYGYGYEQPAYAYEESAQGYGYAKRSVDSMGPVLAAMASAEEKYH